MSGDQEISTHSRGRPILQFKILKRVREVEYVSRAL